MWSLYPDIKPYANHSLRVDDMHTVHIEECGNPQGSVFLRLPARNPLAWDESEINQDIYDYNFDQTIRSCFKITQVSARQGKNRR